MSFKNYLISKVDLAIDLAYKNKHSSYEDAALITMSILSACSAWRWPGKRIDKTRFVELLVKHSPTQFRSNWISVPALINENLILIKETKYHSEGITRIFQDNEIDTTLVNANSKWPVIGLVKLKKFTYANLIYERLRCGYAHQYFPHSEITQYPPSDSAKIVSYIHRGYNNNKMVIMSSFEIDYLIKLAKHHADILPDQEETKPSTWWLETNTL